MAAVVVLSVTQSQKLLLASVQDSAHNQAEALVQTLEGTLSGIGMMTDTLAQSPAVRAYDEKALEPELKAIMEHNPSLSAVYASVEKTGQIYVMQRDKGQISHISLPADYDPRTRDWYKLAKSTGKLAYSPAYLDVGTNEFVITLSVPYKDPTGNFAGVVGADMLLTDLTKLVTAQKFGQNGYAFLIDSNGVFLAHPDQKLISTRSPTLAASPTWARRCWPANPARKSTPSTAITRSATSARCRW
jgi:methyl-accepting chemotaxis protein